MDDRYQDYSPADLLAQLEELAADYEGEQTHTAYLRGVLRDVSRALGNTSCNADYSDLAPAVADLRAERELLRAALSATVARIGGSYDWNADPDGMTLMQSKALEVRP